MFTKFLISFFCFRSDVLFLIDDAKIRRYLADSNFFLHFCSRSMRHQASLATKAGNTPKNCRKRA